MEHAVIAAITGAGGFIGRATVEAILSQGLVVREHMGPETFDIADAANQRDFFEGAQVVVHLAGPPSVAESVAHPVECVRAHVVGTAAVIEAMRTFNVARIVYVSSAEVYGDAGEADVREDALLSPRSPYGAAKAGAELLLRASAAAYGIRGYILRPFSIYGRNVSTSGVIHAIVEQVRSNDEDIVLNDLAPIRDYCFVEDAATAIAVACTVETDTIRTLNVGTGVGTSVLDLARTIDQLMNGCAREIRQRNGATRAGEIYRLVADVSAAGDVLGWRATYDLTTGLSRMLQISGR